MKIAEMEFEAYNKHTKCSQCDVHSVFLEKCGYLAGFKRRGELAAKGFSDAYSEALREGCDADGAKDCGMEAIRKLDE